MNFKSIVLITIIVIIIIIIITIIIIIIIIIIIKTITKFSNVISYQQPDLNINWTVAHVLLVIGQYAHSGAFCWVNCRVFQHS